MEIQLIDVDPISRKVFFILKAKEVTGISKLIQIVVLSLLNVPGRDVFDPEKGGGLPELVGMNIGEAESTEMFAEIAGRVKKSEREILEAQIGIDDPADEKLSEIQIVEITEGEQIDAFFVRIRVVNQAGQASDIMV